MVLREALLKILVCPVDKGCLMYFADENLLYNPRLRRAYRIAGAVPVMLAERAEPVTEREHDRLLSRAGDGAVVLSAGGQSAAGLATLLSGVSDGQPYPVTASGGMPGPAATGSSAPA